MAIKFDAETLAQKASLHTDENNFIVESEIESDSIWAVDNLKKLTVDEIEERLWQVEEQSTLIKWRLWYALRKKFQSDKLFGQHVIEIREQSTRPNWPSSPRDITRSIACGRFCDDHNIIDITSVKIHQGTIEALSKVSDKKVVTKILREIRRRYVPVVEVEKLIYQATAVHTIEQEVEVISYDPKPTYVIPVIDNVAVGADLYVQQVWTDNIDVETELELTIMVDDSGKDYSPFQNVDSGIGISRLETIDDRVTHEINRILDMGLSITENIKKADELIDIASKVKAHFLNMRYPKK